VNGFFIVAPQVQGGTSMSTESDAPVHNSEGVQVTEAQRARLKELQTVAVGAMNEMAAIISARLNISSKVGTFSIKLSARSDNFDFSFTDANSSSPDALIVKTTHYVDPPGICI
jgi:hypothetical protein